MHSITHLKILFKWALHFRALAIACFNRYKAAINSTALRASLLMKYLTTCTTHLLIEALCLVSNVQRKTPFAAIFTANTALP